MTVCRHQGAVRVAVSKVVPPMLNASVPIALSPACSPVRASPGFSVLASLMVPNNESRLMLPNGVTKVSVTVPGVVTPSAVTSGVAV